MNYFLASFNMAGKLAPSELVQSEAQSEHFQSSGAHGSKTVRKVRGSPSVPDLD